jgi:uncharacterized RDD family membrane protein YckC
MYQPPDPNAPTEPIPIVVPPGGARPGRVYEPRRQAPPPASSQMPYAHRFGNVTAYMLGRAGAFFVDAAVVPFVIATFGFHAFETGFLSVGGRDEGGFLTLAGLAFAIAFGFAYLCEAIVGTTLGKAIFALHTRHVDGRHAGPVRVLVRYLLRPIDLLLIGPLLALSTPRHRTLGDFAAGTIVSRSRIGLFATLIGVLLAGGLAYAQVVYGGGITSALEVVALTSNFAPDVVAKGVHAAGLGPLPYRSRRFPRRPPRLQPAIRPRRTRRQRPIRPTRRMRR